MENIYAVLYITEDLDALEQELLLLVENNKNTIVILGDILDDYYKTYFIYRFQQSHPNQVIVLKGKEEDLFLQCMIRPKTIKDVTIFEKYATVKQIKDVRRRFKKEKDRMKMYHMLLSYEHRDIIPWIESLELTFEDDTYLFGSSSFQERTTKQLVLPEKESNEIIIKEYERPIL